jgi:hypothetical protein
MAEMTCHRCQKKFYGRTTCRYCSDICRQRAYRTRIKRRATIAKNKAMARAETRIDWPQLLSESRKLREKAAEERERCARSRRRIAGERRSPTAFDTAPSADGGVTGS